MFQTLLAFFGYVKVPQEAVQLSMCLENDFAHMITVVSILGKQQPKFQEIAKNLEVRKEAMKTMTKFLRSGRLLQ